MSGPPLDIEGRRAPSADELALARRIVARSGLVEALAPHLDAEVGRPRRLPTEALLVALQANALQPHHQAHLVDTARLLNSMGDEDRRRLGIVEWDPDEAYPRVVSLFAKLCRVLDAGIDGIDASWFANRLARAAVPKHLLTSRSVAVDGTDLETWGAFAGSTTVLVLDGEAASTDETSTAALPHRPAKKVTKAKVLGLGPDGRRRYTADPDARAGHRSANGRRNAGPYLGYELHLAVQARDVRWTNYIDRTTLGPEVPNVITALSLVPAGAHRAKSIVGALIEDKRQGHDITDVIWDRGYSQCQPETAGFPLARADIAQTIQLTTNQRGIRPFSNEALLVDGQLFSTSLPTDLRDLRTPPMAVPVGPYLLKYEEAFNRRARWRLVRHAKPDADGYTRWRCPFCAGLLRSRSVPKTMRRPSTTPLVTLPHSIDRCCQGTVSATPADLPFTQRIPFGTTAWRISMNRRMVVESVNAALKGGFVDLARGFFRVFGLTKITALLSFTLAAVNLDRVRSHEAKVTAQLPTTPRRRRLGTWQALLDHFTSIEGISEQATGPPG